MELLLEHVFAYCVRFTIGKVSWLDMLINGVKVHDD